MNEELRTAIHSWRDDDPDPDTVAAVDRLLEQADADDDVATAELRDAFGSRLSFGTAGLRGPLGPGPNRMNRRLVGQAAAGLAGYLHDQQLTGEPVIIGYDARHKSAEFARDTAEIMAGAGFRPMLTESPTPTPVVAFGIKHFRCVAGIVVTASHNPAQDNGYKVYLGDGSQIVPPADAEIAGRIDRAAQSALADVPRSADVAMVGADLIEAYLERAVSLTDAGTPRAIEWVYTPIHGVGGQLVTEVVRRLGFPAAHVVKEQADPDPDFPTVAFPNPEEPGALDLAITAAKEHRADLVLANDPDADRCAVAVPAGDQWRVLRGDELGVLLADDALRRGVQGVYACSIVSSSLLQAMAADHDQQFRYTLTGFKWIGRVPGLVYGYEEALGYCCDPQAIADKDGITALTRVLAIAAELKDRGSTLTDRLDEITRRHGVYATDQLTVRVDDLSIIEQAMTTLRTRPPAELIGQPVTVDDLADGVDLGPAGVLPPTDAIMITGESIKVVARPSGTEPKLKCYLEVKVPADGQDCAPARATAARILDQLRAQMAAALGVQPASGADHAR